MDRRLQRLFIAEIGFQCECIIWADGHLQTARTATEAWYSLQALLIAAANVQKLAWGQGAKRAGPRFPLRQRLGIADNSSFHNPDLRNDFEHFDERLDEWFAQNPTGGRYTTRGRSRGGNPFRDARFAGFGHYEADSGIVTFDQKQHFLSLPPIVTEARELLAKVEQEIRVP